MEKVVVRFRFQRSLVSISIEPPKSERLGDRNRSCIDPRFRTTDARDA
ncbi:hypothetical protein RRSWK_04134 [Rhodopirellula sp. SWK7]|nr:hypothetical protein RRSWK_04134 [Rhodopirellula sp. SWK7]